MSSKLTTGVIICTRNRAEVLKRCLTSVAAQQPDEIIVVDNAPADDSTRRLVAGSAATYVCEPAVGLSRARNRGALASSADVVAFIDDDAMAEPGWLEALAGEFADPKVMAVAGRILPASLETPAERLFERAGGFTRNGVGRMVVDGDTKGWFALANFGGIGAGANIAVRRAAFESWPGFNPQLGRGTVMGANEEQQAFFELIERGYRVVYTPQAKVQHPYARTMRELRTRHLQTIHFSSAYVAWLFAEKPACRKEVLAFVSSWILGRWPAVAAGAGPRLELAARWQVLLALISGPLRCGMARRARSRSHSRAAPVSTARLATA